jgi:hypothetical protein
MKGPFAAQVHRVALPGVSADPRLSGRRFEHEQMHVVESPITIAESGSNGVNPAVRSTFRGAASVELLSARLGLRPMPADAGRSSARSPRCPASTWR